MSIHTENELDDTMTQLRNTRDAQYLTSFRLTTSFNCFGLYFLPKNFVSLARRIVARADMQAKALMSMSGLRTRFVAKLSADLELLLSKIPSSVKPAVLLSTYVVMVLFVVTQ